MLLYIRVENINNFTKGWYNNFELDLPMWWTLDQVLFDLDGNSFCSAWSSILFDSFLKFFWAQHVIYRHNLHIDWGKILFYEFFSEKCTYISDHIYFSALNFEILLI